MCLAQTWRPSLIAQSQPLVLVCPLYKLETQDCQYLTSRIMSHHLFLLSPSDTPLYSLTHHSTKPAPSVSSPLTSNLPTWSTSAFAGTLTALSGASSVTQHHVQGGGVRMGGGQDRHVIQMIANASLDVIEDVMRKENTMFVPVSLRLAYTNTERRYLKSVDKFNEWTISAFITPGSETCFTVASWRDP